MQGSRLFSAITMTGILLTGTVFSQAANAVALSPDQKKEVEHIVRDLLNREPDLIEASLRSGMEKKEEQAREEARGIIKENHAELFDNKQDPFLGNKLGTVTMVVFMDPYCGYCRKFQSNVLAALKERKELKVIYKAYPIMGPPSKLAVEEELAANAIGRFKDFHEAIYESSVHTRKDRLNLAEKNRIDVKEMKNFIPGISKSSDAGKIEKAIASNMKLGEKLGIHGTPAFIIGDDLNPGYVEKETLLQMIDEHAKSKG